MQIFMVNDSISAKMIIEMLLCSTIKTGKSIGSYFLCLVESGGSLACFSTGIVYDK